MAIELKWYSINHLSNTKEGRNGRIEEQKTLDMENKVADLNPILSVIYLI